MGRRRQRKQLRRKEQRTRDRYPRRNGDIADDPTGDMDWLFADARHFELSQAAPEPTCGRCREFVEDGDFGRGSCLHPASGVFAPWSDTPGCPYYARDGRRF